MSGTARKRTKSKYGKNNCIIMSRYYKHCFLYRSVNDLVEYRQEFICEKCLEKYTDNE